MLHDIQRGFYTIIHYAASTHYHYYATPNLNRKRFLILQSYHSTFFHSFPSPEPILNTSLRTGGGVHCSSLDKIKVHHCFVFELNLVRYPSSCGGKYLPIWPLKVMQRRSRGSGVLASWGMRHQPSQVCS